MNKKFSRIEPERLKKLSENKDVMDTYFYKYPIIKNLYWKRLEKMLEISDNFSAKTVLDLGCGQGVFLPSLSNNFDVVHGIDLDISIAAKIKEIYNLSNVTLHENDILNTGFDNGQFDLIFAPSVLEHFQDLDALFTELKRILNTGGKLVFSSPTETKLYELGRKIFGAVKPEDHYHSVFEIQNTGRKYLKYIRKSNGPLTFIPSILSVYIIYVFEKDK